MEGGIRVPFIVSGPKIKANESKVPVIGYDLLPTIIDIVDPNFIPKENIDGGSFKKVLFGDVEVLKYLDLKTSFCSKIKKV